MLREWSQIALTQECVETIGERDASAACTIVSREVWATSTSMPARFSAAIAARPSADRPPCSVSRSPRSRRGLQESASALWPLCVSVM